MERRLRACRKGERNDADKEGGRAREGARGQASRQNSILPKPKLKVPQGPCAGRGNREPPGSTDRKSSGCPKGQAVNILSALANPRGGEAAPGTHDAHQQRDPPPSLPGQPPGKLQLDGKTHAQHTCSSIRPTGPRPLSSLRPAQLTGEPVPRSVLLPPSSVDAGPSRARLPPLPSVLQGPPGCRCPTLLLPGHLGCCALCCVRSAQHAASTAARPPAPSEGLLCVSCLQRERTVFAAEQHSLGPSMEQWKPKATSTRMPHPNTQNARVQRLDHRPAPQQGSEGRRSPAGHPTPPQTSLEAAGASPPLEMDLLFPPVYLPCPHMPRTS